MLLELILQGLQVFVKRGLDLVKHLLAQLAFLESAVRIEHELSLNRI